MANVHWKIEALNRSRRGLDERLLLVAPAAVRVLGRFLAGRQAGSRSRQLLITRVIRVGFAANNRLDHDSMCVFFDPGVEIRLMGGGAAGIDLEPVYWGHEGLRKLLHDWRAGFEQFRFEPREAIDPGGDRFGVVVEFQGQTSGVVTRQLSGFIFTLRGGLAMRQDIHWDSAAAVEALLTRAH